MCVCFKAPRTDTPVHTIVLLGGTITARPFIYCTCPVAVKPSRFKRVRGFAEHGCPRLNAQRGAGLLAVCTRCLFSRVGRVCCGLVCPALPVCVTDGTTYKLQGRGSRTHGHARRSRTRGTVVLSSVRYSGWQPTPRLRHTGPTPEAKSCSQKSSASPCLLSRGPPMRRAPRRSRRARASTHPTRRAARAT